MYPFYLGLDLHLKKTYAVLLDRQGNVVDERQVRIGDLPTYLDEVVPHESYAVLDATRNRPFLYDLLAEHVMRVELAHPKELKANSSAAVKTDRIDARVLAQLARLNYLPVAYAAPASVRHLRLLMRHCDQLVGARTQAKNRVHAILAAHNLRATASDLFGVRGRETLKGELCPQLRPAVSRVIFSNLLLIDRICEQLKELEEALELTPVQDKSVSLLRTVPGFGKMIALTIIAEIGDIRRFFSPKALCNWAGLAPRMRQSAAITRHGSISKQGSPLLRGALTQAAVVASRRSKRWNAVHERMAHRHGKHVAKVAVARRLLPVVYYMLKQGEPYQEAYPSRKQVHRGA